MFSSYASDTPTGYSPQQIKKAYEIDSNFGSGKGKTIALVTAYGNPNLENDLKVFDTQYGLPDADVTIHSDGVTDSDNGWALETSLDVEWAHAMAPDAKLLVVEAPSENSYDLLEAVEYAKDYGAQIISMSWGSDEEDFFLGEDYHFSDSSAIFIAACGDNGAASMWPACSPDVIAVGGTTLKLDSDGNRTSETAWSKSGGGTSAFEDQPSWQGSFGIESDTRTTPDVSFDANPSTGVSVYCSVIDDEGTYGWYKIGGTSSGAPAWAGIVADLNQDTSSIKNAGTFYSLAGGTGYTNPNNSFFDIVSGSNGNSATDGYDLATGLGSPSGYNLAPRGTSYSAHVQQVGWQPFANNGAISGTEGKSLRMEAVKIKLTGDVPQGASIIYKAHVQSIGWQKGVSDGALAGTSGLSKRMEALKITLSGFPGYEVKYRAHVQNIGWMNWQTTQNGTSIDDAPTAGTVGKALRVEAVEIMIEKAAA